jgi:hypothetical protein
MSVGGAQPRLLEGRAVWVAGRPGVIGARSGHLTPRSEHGQGLSLADLYVDLGVDSAGEVEALGVRVGDPVVVLSELRALAGWRVAGKGIDNRASCVLLLHLLRRLQGRALPHRLTALITVQEEVGLRGGGLCTPRARPGHRRGHLPGGRYPRHAPPDLHSEYRSGRVDRARDRFGGQGIPYAASRPRRHDRSRTARRRAVPTGSNGRWHDRRGGDAPGGWRHRHAPGEHPAPLLALARRVARLTRSGRGARSGGGTRAASANQGGPVLPEGS